MPCAKTGSIWKGLQTSYLLRKFNTKTFFGLLKIPNYRGSKVALGLAVAASLDLTCNFAVAQALATEPRLSSGAVSSSQQGEELGRIVVTGYIIPRIGEGPQPVLTLDKDFIQKQGSQTVANVIERLTFTPSSFFLRVIRN